MALEKTILTGESLAALLHERYGLRVLSSHRLKLGSANCYRVWTETGDFFLKEFQSGCSAEDSGQEAALVNLLAGRGIPVARFLAAKDGAPFVSCQGHLICLQQFIEGTAYGYDDFPQSLLPQAAQMLGRLHAAMRDLTLPVTMGDKFIEDFSPHRLAGQYEALYEQAKALQGDPHQDRLMADLNYKRELAHRCAGYVTHYQGITVSPSHGDYQGCQLICGADHIKAVIDFSSARTLPVVWEVMRSYVQSSPVCRLTAALDLPGLCDYVRQYMRYFPLTLADLRAMPYVYLFQLARSKYGFPQYLSGESEDREGLLRFAFWRTDICREVERRAGEISDALCTLLP